MAYLRDRIPYIWVTWLAKILAGDSSCEWAAWFKARYASKSWQRAARSDFSSWAIAHTALLDRSRRQWDDRGFSTFVEDQNSFRLCGNVATLAGKPDLIAVNGTRAVISDAKTGQPKPSHQAQVMLYMYAVPRALPQHAGRVFEGAVVYGGPRGADPRRGCRRRFHQNLRGVHPPTLGRRAARQGSKQRGVPVLRHYRGRLPGAGL